MTITTTDQPTKPKSLWSDFDHGSKHGLPSYHTEYRGIRIDIMQDDDPQNPRRDYDQYGTMACFHGRYDLGDEDTGLRSEDFEGWADMARHIEKKLDGRVIIPLYLIDHSGISMRAGRDFRDCDPGGWDSGQVGFIFMTGPQIRENFMVKRITKDILAKVDEGLRCCVTEYDDYLRGNCYGYRLTAVDTLPAGLDDAELDSCWGFIGDDYIVEAAVESADYYADKIDAVKAAEDFEAIAASDPMGLHPGL